MFPPFWDRAKLEVCGGPERPTEHHPRSPPTAYAFVMASPIQTEQRLYHSAQLSRLLAPERERPLDSARGNGAAAWLTAGDWRLYARPRMTGAPVGEEIERFKLPTGQSVAAVMVNGREGAWVPFDLEEAYRNFVSESWRGGAKTRSLSKRQLRVYYAAKKLMPRRAQLAARRMYTRWVGYPEFPSWPIDDSVALLLRFYARLLLGPEA